MFLGLLLRSCSLLALVAAGTAGVLWLCLPALTEAPPSLGLDGQLLRACAAALLLSWAWWSIGALAMVVELMATGQVHRTAQWAPRVVRLLVGGLCGVGVTVATAVPAVAHDRLLDGLPLPDRPAGVMVAEPATQPTDPARRAFHVVAPGESLWHIARAHGLGWTELYAANRAVVGSDPDLIHPGLRLTVPGPSTARGSR